VKALGFFVCAWNRCIVCCPVLTPAAIQFMSAPVIFSTITTASSHRFGHAVLNNSAALNALTLPMIDLLDPQLKAWAQDDSIAGVVLSAAGD